MLRGEQGMEENAGVGAIPKDILEVTDWKKEKRGKTLSCIKVGQYE